MKKIYNGLLDLTEKYYWFFFAALAAATAFLCFRCLDIAYVSSWDEARHGVSAYEMMQSGSYIVNTFGYEPDYWNLKPPLSFYGIMLGFRIFGYSVRGLRFYSALAYFVICIGIGLFLKKYNKLTSLIGMCFLCCNYHILSFHCARSGDADALYLMFFVFAMLAMLEIPQKHSRLYVCGLCFAGAFLSKSFHAGVIAMIGGLYLLLTGEIRRIRPKEWLLFLLSFLLPVGLWAGARFAQDGMTFFREMIRTDLLSRSSSASEGHAGNFLFYFDAYLKDFQFIYPYLLITAVLGTGAAAVKVFKKDRFAKETVSEIIGYALWLIVPFFFFSAVSTKLVWYGYPLLIPLEVIAAIVLGRFLTKSSFLSEKWLYPLKMAAAAFFLFLIVTRGYDTYVNAVRDIHGDAAQDFIAMSIERDSAFAGQTAYIDAPQEMEDGTVWNQHLRFMAEISGDLHCEDGGTEEFLQGGEALLYISAGRYEEKKAQLSGCETVYETDQYKLLVKTEEADGYEN